MRFCSFLANADVSSDQILEAVAYPNLLHGVFSRWQLLAYRSRCSQNMMNFWVDTLMALKSSSSTFTSLLQPNFILWPFLGLVFFSSRITTVILTTIRNYFQQKWLSSLLYSLHDISPSIRRIESWVHQRPYILLWMDWEQPKLHYMFFLVGKAAERVCKVAIWISESIANNKFRYRRFCFVHFGSFTGVPFCDFSGREIQV